MKIAQLLQLKKAYFVLFVVLVLLLGAVATTHAAPAESGTYHVVQWGETLSGIAYRYGVSPQAILQANPYIYNPNLIYAGLTLYIPHVSYTPPPAPPPGTVYYCRYYHTVSYGQNLIGIGRYYGVSAFAIAEANHIYNLNYIYAGQSLCIP